jgi:excisionase family DNA binding protein
MRDRMCRPSDDPYMRITNGHAERVTYTVEEVAQLLGISRTTAYESVRRGEIPACRFGRRLVVPVRTVDEILSRRS